MRLRGSVALLASARDVPIPGDHLCHCGGLLPPIVFTHHIRCVQVKCPRCATITHCYAELD